MICVCGNKLELVDEDSRQEWVERTYQCNVCGKSKIHKQEFNQMGLVISDKIVDGDEIKMDAEEEFEKNFKAIGEVLEASSLYELEEDSPEYKDKDFIMVDGTLYVNKHLKQKN